MAKQKQTNREKLVNQINKNKGFQNVINNILDTTFITNNPSIIIDDNPKYINTIMELADSYEFTEDDVELVSRDIVKALAKTKLLHNTFEDVSRLSSSFNETLKESGNEYPIAADIFQIIRCELPDITDEDAARSSMYISMYGTLREVFGSVYSGDLTDESVAESSEKNESQLDSLDLMKIIKSRKEIKEDNSTTETKTEQVHNELGEEVIVGGKKAHKVKSSKTPKPTTVAIAASESSKPDESLTDGEVVQDSSELKDDKTTDESVVQDPFDKPRVLDIVNDIMDSLDENIKDKIIDIASVNKLVDIAMALCSINDDNNDESRKVLKNFVDDLSTDKKTKLKELASELKDKNMINPDSNIKDVIKNLMSSEKFKSKVVINDAEFEQIITSASTNDEVARRFKTRLILDIVGGDHYAIKELYSAGYTRNVSTIKNAIINVCENDQNKCDMVVKAFKEYQFTIEYLSEYSIDLSPLTMFGKSRKLA